MSPLDLPLELLFLELFFLEFFFLEFFFLDLFFVLLLPNLLFLMGVGIYCLGNKKPHDYLFSHPHLYCHF